QHPLEATREVIELAPAVGHYFNGIALVRHRMDVVSVVIIEILQHVVEGAVEPRIAFRHQCARAVARERAFRQGSLGSPALACGLDMPLDRGGAPAMLARAVREHFRSPVFAAADCARERLTCGGARTFAAGALSGL